MTSEKTVDLKIKILNTKDEFFIEPRYAHTKKNLDKSEKKAYGGSKLIYENTFIKKIAS